MPNPFLIDQNLFLQQAFTPAAVNWNRLEGRPRKEDFTRSLRAEVRDPLWMICRQWQLGEFRAENTGSAVTARLQINSAKLDRYAPAGDTARPYDDTLPLEVRVEREPVPMSLAVRVQIGRHFARLLGNAFSGVVKGRYLERYAIQASTDPEKAAQLASDVNARAYFSAVVGRVIDGGKLLAENADGKHEIFVTSLPVADTVRGTLRATATELTLWFARLYNVPDLDERVPWQPSRLEYQFRCGAPSATTTGSERTVIAANAYPGGRLEWHAFDVDSENLLPGDADSIPHPPLSFLPAPIQFGGMPNVRWWQFEDRKTDFGNLRASTTDLALLMIAELALVYGNDWLLAPYDLPAGSMAQIGGIMITDVFGVRTFVRPAGSRPEDSWQHWNLFNLHNPAVPAAAAATRSPLLLLATLGERQEGAVLEAVTLTRDEMANLVFAIEETIPGEIGNGVGGAEAARALEQHLRASAPASPEEIRETDARVRYVAGTTVPEHWIPFLPVQISATSGDVRLQRGRMARTIANAPTATVAPRGEILRHGLDHTPPEPYFIEEEEVPAAGARVFRAFQRTRWYDGRIFVWLARRKTLGRLKDESGLQFDQVE